MKICKCVICKGGFEMPDNFMGVIRCENCDPNMHGYIRPEYRNLLKAARLDLLDCEIVGIYVRRNELTGRPDPNDRKPYEIVIGVPASMGESGINISMYYDGFPMAEGLYDDMRGELKERTRNTADILYGSYGELRIKAMKKALRTAPKKWAEIKGGV